MDEEDFLAAVEADNAGVPVEEPKVEAEAPKPEEQKQEEQPQADRPRNDKGQFAPKEEPKAEEVPQPTPPPPPAQPDPGFVPIGVVLDTRDKLKAAEAELAQFRARQQQAPQQVPDVYEDPEGYAQYQESRIQNAILNQTLNTSERFARKEHGADTVEAAKRWGLERFASDPLYQQQVISDPDPYEKLVGDYRREQLFAKVGDPSEFDAFLQWKAAQQQLQQQGQTPPGAPAPTNPASPIPPPSLASAPSAGTILTEPEQTDEEMFAEVIPKG